MNDLKEALLSGKKICGTLVSLTDPALCEFMGNIGYDCVWIDMEHTYMSYKEVLCHLNAAKSSGIPAIVRLPQNDLTATKKVLEMGPDGVIFPMAKSAAEIKELMDMTLYPPYGTRGVGPMRAIGYGAIDTSQYMNEKNFDMLRFVQIEHYRIIDEIDEVVKIPYLDGLIFGPCDLSCSLGDNLNVFEAPTFDKIKYAINKIKEGGKISGIAGSISPSDIQKWAELEPDMLFAGADWCFVYSQGVQTLKELKKYNY